MRRRIRTTSRAAWAGRRQTRRDNPTPTDEDIRECLSGNFCRCTGYQGIINAVHRAAEMT